MTKSNIRFVAFYQDFLGPEHEYYVSYMESKPSMVGFDFGGDSEWGQSTKREEWNTVQKIELVNYIELPETMDMEGVIEYFNSIPVEEWDWVWEPWYAPFRRDESYYAKEDVNNHMQD